MWCCNTYIVCSYFNLSADLSQTVKHPQKKCKDDQEGTADAANYTSASSPAFLWQLVPGSVSWARQRYVLLNEPPTSELKGKPNTNIYKATHAFTRNSHTNICRHIHTRTHTRTHIDRNTQTCMHTHTYTHTCTHTHTHAHTHTHTRTHTHTHTHTTQMHTCCGSIWSTRPVFSLLLLPATSRRHAM